MVQIILVQSHKIRKGEGRRRDLQVEECNARAGLQLSRMKTA